ncbi:methyltransferase domain-containing protein [Candidatus Bathyarchaeota archaeon]|nr:methyltransferase domain-containing protein [Candidatus Bathyarchaeota archaeon]
MTRLFLTLSGEHEALPFAEVKAILEAENHAYKIVEVLDQLVRLDAEIDSLRIIANRAAYTRICGLELLCCTADLNVILKSFASADFSRFLRNGETFAVRVKHVKRYSPQIDGMLLEKKLGTIILKCAEGARVNLKKPDKTFVGVLTSKKFVFGLKFCEVLPKSFVERRPRRKPFFHPSAMQAKLARCMVNLSRPKRLDVVLDPFCGTGTMLIEAALLGCQAIGLDVQRRMVRGSRRNLEHFGITSAEVVLADMRKMPITKVDCVVTDPPYGVSSSTLKQSPTQLVKCFFQNISHILDQGKYICIAAPTKMKITQIAANLDYKHLESYKVYVHRSLTREVAVFKKGVHP